MISPLLTQVEALFRKRAPNSGENFHEDHTITTNYQRPVCGKG